jgi:transposase
MAKARLPDELWFFIAARVPVHPPTPRGGRPRISDRAALTGILFVLRTRTPWEYLPRELGCGNGMTFRRRLHEWMQAGGWQSVHQAILRRLRKYDQIVWDLASIDAAGVPSPFGGEHTGATRLIVASSAANTTSWQINAACHWWPESQARKCTFAVHRSRLLIPLVEAIPALKGLSGRARERPENLHADRAYASPAHRAWLRRRGIAARVTRYGVESRERPGRWHWVVERTLGWLHRFRRLRMRHERRADIHQAFLSLACSLICWRYVEKVCSRF